MVGLGVWLNRGGWSVSKLKSGVTSTIITKLTHFLQAAPINAQNFKISILLKY